MKPTGIRLKTSAAMLSAAMFSPAFAEPVTFEPIHITASRTQTDVTELSRNIEFLSSADIEQQQAASIPELLRYSPNIDLVGGPRSSVQSVNIRGLGGDRVLQLVDGVRQNFVSGHRPSYFLEPELLKSVEVIRGPASSLWGSGAVGGVVSQNTKTASDLLAGRTFGGFIKQGWRSNDDRSVTTMALATQQEDIGVLVSGYYRDGNDIKLGNNDRLSGSSMRDKGVMGKFDWQLDDNQHLTLNVRSSRDEGNVPSNGAAPFNDTSNFLIRRRNDTDHVSLDYRLNPHSDLINSQLLAYWNQTEMQEYRLSDLRADKTRIQTLGMSLNNQSTWQTVRWLYGVDAYQDKLSSSREGDNRPTPPDATTTIWGVYSEVHLPFAERWQLELGGRYDHFRTRASNLGDSRSDDAFSPSAALVWKTTEQWTMTLRYDEAFRAPTAEELYTTGTHFCITSTACNTFLPDASLKPEQAHNIELMTEFTDNDFWQQGDKLTFNAAIFRNHVDNFIEQQVDDPIFTSLPFPPFFSVDAGHTRYRNVDKARLTGGELGLNYQWAGYDIGLSYGRTRAENRKTGESLSGIPADKWVFNFAHTWAPTQLTAGLRLTHAEAQRRLPDNIDQQYDSYTVTDLYASWQPRQLDGLKLDLTVNNLTNRHYRMAFQALHMQGRDVRLTASYAF